ncbi:hypothetical protein [Kribbella sp. DT2]|uniref:hypothetical protein n=1 Tax=Kribbella sp. DT2 TaxID=3393427 RepID=UPI003CF3D7A7
MGLEDVVRKAAAAVDGADLAAVELAATYGAAIDDGGDVDKTGPLLLAALESLLMTPRARAATAKGGDRDGRGSNPLDELRARRGARVNNPPAVDSAAT